MENHSGQSGAGKGLNIMTVECDFYGIEEEKVILEVDEKYLRKDQIFNFEGQQYIIVSIIPGGTKAPPKANVMLLSSFQKRSKMWG